MTPFKQLCRKLIPLSLALALVVSFLLSAVTPLSISASTEVSGEITSDTTWTEANSPYIVTSNVLVSEGVTLTIEPGVVVKFESGKAMQIDGELIARGTEGEPIVFTSNQASPAPGDWGGIIFSDSSVNATYDAEGNYLSGCIMQYCRVEYTGVVNTSPVRIVSSFLFIDHCDIADSAGSYIYVDGGSARITNNTMVRSGGVRSHESTVIISGNTIANGSGGISIGDSTALINGNAIINTVGYGVHAVESAGTISGNIITNSSSRGIWANKCTLTISGNIISNNLDTAIYAEYGELTINGNIITNNSAGLPQGGGIYAEDSTLTIRGNAISSNSAEWGGGGIYALRSTATISGNTICDNSAEYGSGICAHNSRVTISGNTICNNSAEWNDGGAVSLGQSSGGGQSSTGAINHNDITGNSGCGISIGVGCGQLTINNNNIHDNTPYDVYNGNEAGTIIDATSNWWGTTDEAAIQEHIYEWYDNASLGVVNYSPYFSQPVLCSPTGLTAEPAGAVIDLNWQAVSGATGYKVYYDVDRGFPYQGTGANEGDSPIDVENTTSFTISGLNLGTRYYFAITAYNPEGESWYSEEASAGPADGTPPTTPVVVDDGDYTASATDVHAIWISFDPESGIAEYQYAIGTSPSGIDVVNWTSVGTNTEVTLASLNLTVGTTYYFAVKAKNGQGLWSEAGVSDGITVRSAPNHSPNPPSNVSPTDGVSGISLAPSLQSSAFSDPDVGDIHAASQWQITTTLGDYSNPVFDSDRDTQNLENISIPSEKLSYGSTYYWHVRHQDNNGAWSDWSEETSFTTISSPAPTGGGFPFWAGIIIGVGAAVVIGIVVRRRLARR
jgi:predicted outer membrane repeat protein